MGGDDRALDGRAKALRGGMTEPDCAAVADLPRSCEWQSSADD